MNFLKSDDVPPVYDPLAIPYNYKYNGKELQETGMYDYGARFYMPDIGRWGMIDALSEKAPSWTPYRYAFDNPIKYLDPNGLYEEDGHFWTVYLMATLMGRKDAYSFAYYAEAPDLIMGQNGERLATVGFMGLPTNQAIQRGTHALTGGSSTHARTVAQNMLYAATSYEEIGTALHYFGDSYAHSMIGNESQMYPTGEGHLWDGHDPDKIAERPGLYLEYANSLAGNLNNKFGGNKIDMFTFDYVANSGGTTAQNSAVLETEVRIQEGAKTFSVAGNQVGTINNYLKARNSHYNSQTKANVVQTDVDVYKRNKKGEWEKTTENRTFVAFQ
jgi:RHS repeat-associated protein